jgi:hypothetical protein
MVTITDDQMNALRKATKGYSVMLLKPGPNRHMDGAEKNIREHGRRNLALRAEGLLPIVCPVASEELDGLCIFDLGTEETAKVMEGDPGVRAGVFVDEVYPRRSFPGDSLPV